MRNVKTRIEELKIEELQLKAQYSEEPLLGLVSGEWKSFHPCVFKFEQDLTEKLELYSALHSELFLSIREDRYSTVPLKKVQDLGLECHHHIAMWIIDNNINVKLKKQNDFINIDGFSGVVDENWHCTKLDPPACGGLYWCYVGNEEKNCCQQRVHHYDAKFGWNNGAVTHWRFIPLNPDGSSIVDWCKDV